MSGRQLNVLEGGPAGGFDPASRPGEPDDPVELVGVPLMIDDAAFDEMALTFVEEFVRDGWSDRQLTAMFGAPTYAGLHVIWRVRGEAWVRNLIAETRERWGRPDPDLATPRPGPAGPAWSVTPDAPASRPESN